MLERGGRGKQHLHFKKREEEKILNSRHEERDEDTKLSEIR